MFEIFQKYEKESSKERPWVQCLSPKLDSGLGQKSEKMDSRTQDSDSTTLQKSLKFFINQHGVGIQWKLCWILTIKGNQLFLPSRRDRVRFRVPWVHGPQVLPEIPLVHFVQVPEDRFQEPVVAGNDCFRFRRHFSVPNVFKNSRTLWRVSRRYLMIARLNERRNEIQAAALGLVGLMYE